MLKGSLLGCFQRFKQGLLLLSVDKTSYEQLGLDGKVSTFYGRDSRNKENRRLIRINLTDPAFSPGSKLFERVARCFKQRGSSWTHDYSVYVLSCILSFRLSSLSSGANSDSHVDCFLVW